MDRWTDRHSFVGANSAGLARIQQIPLAVCMGQWKKADYTAVSDVTETVMV